MSNGKFIDPAVFDAMGEEAAAKYGASVAMDSASSFGLGSLLQGLGPLYTAYSVLDRLGFFDSTLQETPMTPEEAAEFEAKSRIDRAVNDVTTSAEGGTEGAMESLEDAMAQGLAAGLAPGDIVAPVVNARIPGVTDIPIVGDVLDGMATAVDKVLDYVGLDDIRADVTIGTDGTVGAEFEPINQKQQNQQQSGTPTQGRSSRQNGSTTTVYSGDGDEAKDILIGGRTGGDVIDAKVGENTTETLHAVMSLLCKDDETYDRATMSCIPKFGTGTKKAEKVTCPEGYEKAGEEVDSYNDCGDKTSTVTVGELCDDPAYAATHPDECSGSTPTTKTCWDGSVIAIDADCPASKICPDGTKRAKEEVGIDEDCGEITPPPPEDTCPVDSDKPGAVIPAGETAASFCYVDTPEDTCPVDSDKPGAVIPAGETAASFCYVDTPEDTCPVDSDKPGAVIPAGETAGNFCYVDTPEDTCPVDSDKPGAVIPAGETAGNFCYVEPPPPPPEDTCPVDSDKPGAVIPAGETAGNFCYVDVEDPCDNPAYAAENPVECGTSPTDPCLNSAYAAENPVECGTVRIIECPADSDKPGRAVPDGETVDSFCYEGTVTTDPCDNPAYAFLNPERCAAATTDTPLPTSGERRVLVEPGEMKELEYFYDVGGESIFAPTIQAASGGKIDNYDLLREVEDLLRGR